MCEEKPKIGRYDAASGTYVVEDEYSLVTEKQASLVRVLLCSLTQHRIDYHFTRF